MDIILVSDRLSKATTITISTAQIAVLALTAMGAQGGAASSIPSKDLSLGDLSGQLDLLTRQVDDRSDKLGALESQAFHEGIDFLADSGTAIHAAAGGVVVYSDFHPHYGNMVEIDHGNELVSRYAHTSTRL